MASAEYSDHQTMLLMVPKPAFPFLPHHLCTCISSSGEQPASPPLPANRPVPLPSSLTALAPLPCEHLHGGVTTEDRPVYTHSGQWTEALSGRRLFLIIFLPQSLAEDSLQIQQISEPAERKGKHGKSRVRSTNSSSSAVNFSSYQNQMERQDKTVSIALTGLHGAPKQELRAVTAGVRKMQGSAVPSRRRSG